MTDANADKRKQAGRSCSWWAEWLVWADQNPDPQGASIVERAIRESRRQVEEEAQERRADWDGPKPAWNGDEVFAATRADYEKSESEAYEIAFRQE